MLCKEDDTVKIEIEREEDGRWIAEVPDLPGVMAYGETRNEAITKVQAPALRVIADRLDHGEAIYLPHNIQPLDCKGGKLRGDLRTGSGRRMLKAGKERVPRHFAK